MSDELPSVKRKRGPPRVHSGETAVISFRAPKKLAVQIGSVLSAIKLVEQRVGDADSAVLMDALEQRLRGLANRQPQLVEQTLRALHGTNAK
jgi:hypothetical protein